MRNNRISEKQTTKKGSKVDVTNLDGEDLKAILEEKLGIELNWDDYTWEAKGDFSGVEVVFNFTESEKGNSYEIGYHKEGSIHDRSTWKGDSKDEFEKDADEMLAELGEYKSEDSSVDEDGTSLDEPSVDNDDEISLEEPSTDNDDDLEILDFGESKKTATKRLQDSLKRHDRSAALKEAKIAFAKKRELAKKEASGIKSKYLKKYEHCTLEEFFEKIGLKEQANRYLKFDKSVKGLDYMLDEANENKLLTFVIALREKQLGRGPSHKIVEALFKDGEECVIEVKENGKWRMIGFDKNNKKGWSTNPPTGFKKYASVQKAKDSSIVKKMIEDGMVEGKDFRINDSDGENHY